MAVFRMPGPPPKAVPTVDFMSGGEGAGVSVSATGLDALEKYLLEQPKFIQSVAGIEMENIAGEIIEDARDNFVPYENGDLRNSAGWDKYEANATPGTGGVTKIKMWFGAPLGGSQARKAVMASLNEGGLRAIDPSVYALDQHENLTYKHPSIGPVSRPQNKYLEKPFLKAEPTFLPRIANAISRALGGKVSGPDIAATVLGITPLDSLSDDLGSMPAYPGYGSK